MTHVPPRLNPPFCLAGTIGPIQVGALDVTQGGNQNDAEAPSSGLSSGALVAIIVLSVLTVGVCTAFGVVIIRRRQREETNSYPAREANYGSISYASV